MILIILGSLIEKRAKQNAVRLSEDITKDQRGWMYYAGLFEDHSFAKEIRLNSLGTWLLDRERNYFTKANENQKKQNDGFIISGFFGAVFTLIQQSAVTTFSMAFRRVLDSLIDFDEEGFEPSGGEGQKIALARALYKDAPIVLLDEPTAAMDPKAEYELYQKFNEMVRGKTAIYISHRLSSAKFCDVIAVFGNGQIIEYGSHDELYRKVGSYTELFSMQSQFYCQ